MTNKKQPTIIQQDKHLDKFIIRLPTEMAEFFNDFVFTNGKTPQEFISFCLNLGMNTRMIALEGGQTVFEQSNKAVEVLVFDESEVDDD